MFNTQLIHYWFPLAFKCLHLLDGISILKCLFGLSSDVNHTEDEKLKNVCDTIENLEQKIIDDEDIALLVGKATLCQV
ncbi:hypothetical protein ZIOFF_010248 [Zingiber officinale]|uniref:Uncharacterized protein n=1 Tax=Zingiber officinale TaxID=94328 RepID=A0A8J5HGQ2_ZINOF|nr:hypothetical protein ZIOFF_010248 [Zingiber officinale]